MTTGNIRPENMERITTAKAAQAFIEEQVKELRDRIGSKKVLLALSGGGGSWGGAGFVLNAGGG